MRAAIPQTESPELPAVWRSKPKAVKGIYVSGAVAGSPAFKEYIDLVDKTELNAMVIDIKDVTGNLTYSSQVPLAKEDGATTNTISNLHAMVQELRAKNIYAIARIPVFEDNLLPRKHPELAVMDSATGKPWQNYGGLTWANPYKREVWDYNIAIAKEAAQAGFNEVQFDYVRFPSDGPMNRIDYGEKTFPTQEDTIAGFLDYAHSQLEPLGVYVAADVFGMIGMEDSVGIGQVVSKLAPHLDVLCPMVYPSHYGPGNYGYPNPNAEPYGVVKKAMDDFEAKIGPNNKHLEIRPWLQDFNMGSPPYGAEQVKAQIQATYDAKLTGWLLWNPANVYTDGALAPAGQ